MNKIVVVKRKRKQNYTAEEKMLFVRTLQDMGHILISKVTSHDSGTNKEKEAVWEKITNHLNASGSVRNVDSYKKLWAKLKSETKTYKSQALHQSQGTGGGPSQIKPDPVLDAVKEITGRGSTGIEGILNADTLVNGIYQHPVYATPTITTDDPLTVETGLGGSRGKGPNSWTDAWRQKQNVMAERSSNFDKMLLAAQRQELSALECLPATESPVAVPVPINTQGLGFLVNPNIKVL